MKKNTKKIISLIFLLFSFFSIYAQKYELSELKEEFEDTFPLRWKIYENDKTILLNPQTERLDLLIELVFQIENDFGFDGMWDEIETLKHFKLLIEKQLDIKCSKCDTYEELDEFVNTEKKAFTSQLSWNDPNDMRKGIKFTKKSDKLEKALIAYKRAENIKSQEFELKEKQVFTRWLMSNHHRIRVLQPTQLDRFYENKKRENVNKWILDNFTKESSSFFNEAYDNNVLERTKNRLAKKYGVFKGPTLNRKSEVTDNALIDLLNLTQKIEFERLSCDETGGTTKEHIVFNPRAVLDLYYLGSNRKDHFLNRYRSIMLSGNQHITTPNQLIKNAKLKAKEIKSIAGQEYAKDWPKYSKNGHNSFLNVVMGISGDYITRNENGQPEVNITYSIDSKGISEDKYISKNEFLQKYYITPPSMRGVQCNIWDENPLFRPAMPAYLKTDIDYKVERATLIKYEYDDFGNLKALIYYDSDFENNKPTIGELPDYIIQKRKPVMTAQFKDNMLNGEVVLFNNSSLSLLKSDSSIAGVIVPNLVIKGETVFSNFTESGYEITKCELKFENNLLNGNSIFHWENKKNKTTGSVSILFTNGLSELDIKEISKLN